MQSSLEVLNNIKSKYSTEHKFVVWIPFITKVNIDFLSERYVGTKEGN